MQYLLDFDGTLRGLQRAIEFDKKGIPHRLDLPTVKSGEDWPQEAVVPGEHLEGHSLVGLRQGRVSDHVREHDRCQTSLAGCHGSPTRGSHVK